MNSNQNLTRLIDVFAPLGPAMFRTEVGGYLVVDERDTLAGAVKHTDRRHAHADFDARLAARAARPAA